MTLTDFRPDPDTLRWFAGELDTAELLARQESRLARNPATEFAQHHRADTLRDVATEARTAALRVEAEVAA